MKLFLLPHQDDECFAIPFCLQENKFSSTFVFITNGCLGEKRSSRRDWESFRALSFFQIHPRQLRFLELGIKDQELVFHLETVFRELLRLPTHEITEVWTPSYEGGHADHDAAAVLGHAIARHSKSKHFFYPTYNLFQRVFPFYRLMKTPFLEPKGIVVTDQRLSLCLLPFFYPSQVYTWIMLFLGYICKCLSNSWIFYEALDSNAFRSRPHSGTLLYEKRGWGSYDIFHSNSTEFLDKILYQ